MGQCRRRWNTIQPELDEMSRHSILHPGKTNKSGANVPGTRSPRQPQNQSKRLNAQAKRLWLKPDKKLGLC